MKMLNRMGLLFILGMLTLAFSNENVQHTAGSEVDWKDFEKGIELAQKEDKKVFIDVYTDWCGYCKKMDKNTFTDDKVVELLNKHFVAIKLDAESKKTVSYKGKEMSKREVAGKVFRVQGFPTTVYLDSDISMLSKPLSGYLSPKTARMVLTFYGKDIYKKQSWEAFKKEYKNKNG